MPNHHHDILVIGGSAGGVEALLHFIPKLPKDLDAAIFIVIHLAADTPSALPHLLSVSGPLPAQPAVDGDPIRPGVIYVAPPDRHLILEKKIMRVTTGPKENGFRPAVDPLFRSAAQAFGPRVIGLVLSGGLDDGTAGLIDIQLRGGITLAQDPADAPFPSMPASAVANVQLDHVIPLEKIAQRLADLVRLPLPAKGPAMRNKKNLAPTPPHISTADADPHDLPPIPPSSTPKNFVCPDCGGSMWELTSDNQLRFRCHTGHVHTADTLANGQKEKVEQALWTAVRALQESAELRRRMSQRLAKGSLKAYADEYARQSKQATDQANLIQHLLIGPAAPLHAPGREHPEESRNGKNPKESQPATQNRTRSVSEGRQSSRKQNP